MTSQRVQNLRQPETVEQYLLKYPNLFFNEPEIRRDTGLSQQQVENELNRLINDGRLLVLNFENKRWFFELESPFAAIFHTFLTSEEGRDYVIQYGSPISEIFDVASSFYVRTNGNRDYEEVTGILNNIESLMDKGVILDKGELRITLDPMVTFPDMTNNALMRE